MSTYSEAISRIREKRDEEIVRLITETTMTHAEIAAKMGLSTPTIRLVAAKNRVLRQGGRPKGNTHED